MRIILDTSVLLSGIFFGGVPGRILAAWQEDRIELVLSPAILFEYHQASNVLATRYPAIDVALGPLLALVTQTATIVDAPVLTERVSLGPADDKFWRARSPRRRR